MFIAYWLAEISLAHGPAQDSLIASGRLRMMPRKSWMRWDLPLLRKLVLKDLLVDCAISSLPLRKQNPPCSSEFSLLPFSPASCHSTGVPQIIWYLPRAHNHQGWPLLEEGCCVHLPRDDKSKTEDADLGTRNLDDRCKDEACRVPHGQSRLGKHNNDELEWALGWCAMRWHVHLQGFIRAPFARTSATRNQSCPRHGRERCM